jgi:hypothetical protein
MIADCPISETSAQAQTNSQGRNCRRLRFLEKSDFSERTQFVIENKRPPIGFVLSNGIFSAQRSAVLARQMVVSRRVDKLRVRCVLSTFIRFHPSRALGFPGVTQ